MEGEEYNQNDESDDDELNLPKKKTKLDEFAEILVFLSLPKSKRQLDEIDTKLSKQVDKKKIKLSALVDDEYNTSLTNVSELDRRIWIYFILNNSLKKVTELASKFKSLNETLQLDMIWNKIWLRTFPGLANDLGTELPDWIENSGGGPNQLNPWKRYFYWTLYFMRRACRHLFDLSTQVAIDDLEETRANYEDGERNVVPFIISGLTVNGLNFMPYEGKGPFLEEKVYLSFYMGIYKEKNRSSILSFKNRPFTLASLMKKWLKQELDAILDKILEYKNSFLIAHWKLAQDDDLFFNMEQDTKRYLQNYILDMADSGKITEIANENIGLIKDEDVDAHVAVYLIDDDLENDDISLNVAEYPIKKDKIWIGKEIATTYICGNCNISTNRRCTQCKNIYCSKKCSKIDRNHKCIKN